MKDIDPEALLAESTVYQEYMRQKVKWLHPDGRFNLTWLWQAAGRKKGYSPRQWDARNVRAGDESVIDDCGVGPDGMVMADEGDALHYMHDLDVNIALAMCSLLGRAFREDPAKHLINCPDGIMGISIAATLMGTEEGFSAMTKEHLIAEVEDRTTGMDPMAQETLVAKVRRAIPDIKMISRDELES